MQMTLEYRREDPQYRLEPIAAMVILRQCIRTLGMPLLVEFRVSVTEEAVKVELSSIIETIMGREEWKGLFGTYPEREAL